MFRSPSVFMMFHVIVVLFPFAISAAHAAIALAHSALRALARRPGTP
jgi:hypothetical protein